MKYRKIRPTNSCETVTMKHSGCENRIEGVICGVRGQLCQLKNFERGRDGCKQCKAESSERCAPRTVSLIGHFQELSGSNVKYINSSVKTEHRDKIVKTEEW